MIDVLLSSETTFTVSSVIILWAIIGGPMLYMKTRYKLFMFAVATSLVGASLDKLTRYAGDGLDLDVLTLAKALIAVSRIGMTVIGVYVLAAWYSQCNQLKKAIISKASAAECRRRASEIVNHNTPALNGAS